jgi:hypothetical protein
MTRINETSTPTDGRADFDFLFGDWQVRHRKLRDVTDPGCTEWIDCGATSRAESILGGLGNVDRIWADAVGETEAWEGFTLRQFDPIERRWRIWWTSTRAPGFLDPPLLGRFVDGVGEFIGDDVVSDRAVRIRFEWTNPSPDTARWAQSFSFDAGAS